MTDDVEILKGLALRNPVGGFFFTSDKGCQLIMLILPGNTKTGRRRRRGCFSKPILRSVCSRKKLDMSLSYLLSTSRCSEVDKFLLTYVILKLRLIKGKCILFVNDVDRSYRLKLFLEQFSIKSCVLNSELPLNSRYV